MKAERLLPLVASAIVAAAGLWATCARSEATTIELSAGLHRIEAEVASNAATRAEGLMHRREMASNRGMLFVFEQRGRHCMWMRNTLIPLSVAFLDDGGAILNVEDMTPLTETSHCAAAPARYALEMNAGWFAQRRLGPGTRVSGIEALMRRVPAR